MGIKTRIPIILVLVFSCSVVWGIEQLNKDQLVFNDIAKLQKEDYSLNKFIKSLVVAIGRLDEVDKIHTKTFDSSFEIIKMFGEDIKSLKERIVELEKESIVSDMRFLENPQTPKDWLETAKALKRISDKLPEDK